ncbi:MULTISPECIES: transglutaminase-like cysteine peptidase [Kordiimonas]|uniref:transglutaminase-like cysteine peptidase n=1 Tax=Kordiimonas TaxID=288021 RepID=UPI002580DA31|nr:transglutaminase-like cysteine peptidase [Kordiimonas sp. UBA4487]
MTVIMRILVICALLVGLSVPTFAASKIVMNGLFGSREIPSSNMKSFDKWTEMWRRHNLPRSEKEPTVEPVDGPPCRGLARIQCGRDAWNQFITDHTESSGFDLLEAVNEYMNKSPYIVDPVNWGIPDYWATPDEFFLKDGDCEDYAISKYITLKRLGVPIDRMRLVILQDENLRTAHAVLAVESEGETYILDNQVDAVLPHGQILHYRPVYSINETTWWLHQVKRFSR